MNTITQFNRQNLRELDSEIKSALQALAKFGIIAEVAPGRFSPDRYTFKVELRIKDSNIAGSPTESVAMVDLRRFEKLNPSFGVLVNRSVTINGSSYKIIGYKPSHPKYPFIAESIRGTPYKFPVSDISRALGLPQLTPINQGALA